MNGERIDFRVEIGRLPVARIVPRNETPAAKLYRLARAQFKAFVEEYPDEAVKIVKELLPQKT